MFSTLGWDVNFWLLLCRVKLEKPRSGYKETAEDVFCVAKFLAILKKEPHASEERVRNHLLEGSDLCDELCHFAAEVFLSSRTEFMLCYK